MPKAGWITCLTAGPKIMKGSGSQPLKLGRDIKCDLDLKMAPNRKYSSSSHWPNLVYFLSADRILLKSLRPKEKKITWG